MSVIQLFGAAALLVALAPPAAAQFVKGNEAVSVGAGGDKRIQLPPLPTTGPLKSAKPCAVDGGCHVGTWQMVETPDGLMECTEAFARPGTCRKSTYGAKKLSRIWVVSTGGKWLRCQFPDLSSKCVDMFAKPPASMPFDAVQ